MKTIALENIDFFQSEWNCLEKHKQSDSMSRVAQIPLHIGEYKVAAEINQVSRGSLLTAKEMFI